MRHFDYLTAAERERLFYRQPEAIGLESDAGLLAVALGATLYCPATRQTLAADIGRSAAEGVMSVVVCLEDAVADADLPAAERNAVEQLREFADGGAPAPLVFVRVRAAAQIPMIMAGLGDAAHVLVGFVLPKFSAETGPAFMAAVVAAEARYGVRLLVMPVLETPEVIFAERRVDALLRVRALLEKFADNVLAVRIGATVVQVTRPARGIAVVRLIADQMVEYLPGQYLSVMTPYAHGVWRRFSPSNPSNPARQLEFHIREVPGGTLSEALVRSVTPGDRWVVARPLGHLEIDRTRTEEGFRDVLVVAGGTGIAPIHCLLVDMLRFADNPRVHLFYGARYPGELEDLRELVDNAGTAPWLTIQPVVEETEDPWWMGETPELPRTLHRPVTGRLVDVVTGYGSWADRQVLVSGSPDMIRATVRGMVAAGTPREAISFDRF